MINNNIKAWRLKNQLWVLLMLCYPLLLIAQQTSLSARLDRTEIVLGETVNLVIELQGTSSRFTPDLSILEGQFDVLNSNSQTRVNISNGQQQSVSQLQIVLEAKQTGELMIPAITVGNQQTQALSLTVQAAPQAPAAGTVAEQPDVFLEVEVQPDTPYVQAQITMIVRLLIGVALSEASLSEPTPDNAEVQKLGDDVRYEAQRSGHRYQVIERQYAVFAQQSGPLVIPAIQLTGRVGASRGSFFGSSSRGRRITRSSETVRLDVLPVPDTYDGNHWLPASALQLRELALDQTVEYRVGEPLTRTLELIALGLSDIMLPDIESEAPIGARVYADKPVGVSGQRDTWVIGQRTIKQAIVPTVAGPLKLPEIRLKWWDTSNNQQRESIVPAVIIDVLPALDGANLPIQVPPSEDQLAPVNLSQPSTTTVVRQGYWPYLSAAFAALWLLTLVGWWRARQVSQQQRQQQQQRDEQQALSLGAARKACQKACQDNVAPMAMTAIITWAKVTLKDKSINNLGQVIAKLDDVALKQALLDLQMVCYGEQQQKWSGKSLWSLLQSGLPVNQSSVGQANKRLLPALYPGA